MPGLTARNLPTSNQEPQSKPALNQVTPDLVRQVTELVWLLWQADLRIEKERQGSGRHLTRWYSHGGG